MFNPTLVHQYLSLSATRHPDKEVLVCGEERWTYRLLELVSDRVADFLSSTGLKRHDRVIIFLDNSNEAVASLYGVLKAGGTFVILNGGLKAKKLSYIVRDSGAAVIIAHMGKMQTVAAALQESPDAVRIVWVGDHAAIPPSLARTSTPWDEAVKSVHGPRKGGPAGSLLNHGGCIDLDLAALIYTSGSTGEPKGVMSSHQNMISAARSIIQYLKNTPDDIILNVLPLSFDYGLYQIIMAIMFGGTVVLERSFAYPVKVLEKVVRERATGFPLVPTIAAYLLSMDNIHRFDFSRVRYMTNTAAALPVEHIRRLRSLFPHVALYSMYGLTECKRVSYLPPEELDRRPSSVGKAIPNSEVSIVDEEGRRVAPGEIGELIIRGANVMRGYWNAPELTERTFRKGEFPGERVLFSGDLFRQDEEGFLYFVGRKDDMIKTKGERVSPREVENVMCEMDGIAEAAVVGVPDEIFGQTIKAFVVCRTGIRLTERDILKYCADNLEPFMVPKRVVFVERFPKSPNGKIDKKSLKDDQDGLKRSFLNL